MLFITYFLYIRECKILHHFDYLMYTKKIFQRKFLKQWRVGNRLADLGSYTIYCAINKIRGIDLLPKDTYFQYFEFTIFL